MRGFLIFLILFYYGGVRSQHIIEISDSLVNNGLYAEATSYIDSVQKPLNEKNVLKARLERLKADALYYQGEMLPSVQAYLQSAEWALNAENPDYNLASISFGEAGYILQAIGVGEKALSHYLNSKRYALIGGDTSQVAVAYSNLGTLYESLGNYEESQLHLDSAYLLDKLLKDSLGIAYDLNNLGYLLVSWRRYDQGIEYYQQSLEIVKRLKRPELIARRYNNIGMAYLLKDDLEKAEQFIDTARQIHQSMGDSLNMAKRLINLGEIEARKGNLNKSITLKRQGIAVLEKADYDQLLIESYNSLAKTLVEAGSLAEAMEKYKQAVNIGESRKFYTDLSKSYLGLSELLKKKGNHLEALQYQSKYIQIRDSIYSEQSRKLIHEMEIKYDVEKKEAEIDLLNTKNQLSEALLEKRQRQQFALITVLILLALFGLYIYFSQRKQFILKEKVLLLEIDELRKRITDIITVREKDVPEPLPVGKLNEYLPNPLSDREVDILKLVSTELTNREIAEKIHVSVNTVKYHLKNIYEKLNVSNRDQALVSVFQATGQKTD